MNAARGAPGGGRRRGPGQLILVVLAVAITAVIAARLVPLLVRGFRALLVVVQSQFAAVWTKPALAVVVVLGAVGLFLVLRRRRHRRAIRPRNDGSN